MSLFIEDWVLLKLESINNRKKEGKAVDFLEETVEKAIQLINKPVGTNYHLLMNQIKDRKRQKEGKFKESFIGVEVENPKDYQVNWIDYFHKKNGKGV